MPTKDIKSIKTCFRILSLFDRRNPRLNADEISQSVDIPRSSVYRYLSSLVQLSILQYDPLVKKFGLGLKVFELGATAFHHLDLRKIALSFMEELARETKETVHLAVLRNDMAVCIERIESDFPVRLSVNRGASFPLHAGATAKVLLAFLPAKEQDRIIEKGLQKFTERTLAAPTRLRKNLKEIKKNGFAYSDQELDLGARAIAAPIFNSFGEVIASLSIAGPIYRFTDDMVSRNRDWVVDTSKKISLKLGYTLEGSSFAKGRGR